MIDKIRSFVWDKDPPVCWTKWDLHSRSYISLDDINNVYYCGAQYEANQYDCSLRLENIGVIIPTNFASWFLKRFLKNMTKIDGDEKHLYFNWIYLNCNSQYKTKASDKIQKIDQANKLFLVCLRFFIICAANFFKIINISISAVGFEMTTRAGKETFLFARSNSKM